MDGWMDGDKFHCDHYHLDILAEKQQGFCAKRVRLAGIEDHCFVCETGKAADRKDRDAVRAAIPEGKQRVRSASYLREHEIRRSRKEKRIMKKCTACGKEARSNGQKTCDCGAKFEKAGSKPKKGGKIKGKVSGKPWPMPKEPAGNGHDCEGCQALQLRIDELDRVEKVMVAAGLVDPEKFEKARKIVRELA